FSSDSLGLFSLFGAEALSVFKFIFDVLKIIYERKVYFISR
ncbi:MAG: hypothetical protein ACI86H_002312, partial [bacterium]